MYDVISLSGATGHGIRKTSFRTAIAVLLLSVVLPMSLVAPFHHHDDAGLEDLSCELCEHHQPHPAHLTAFAHLDNCLICQFLGESFLPEASLTAPDAMANGSESCMDLLQEAPSVLIDLLSTRAPPYTFC